MRKLCRLRLVSAGTHPDFVSIARPEESNVVPIEMVRELCAAFSLKPARGHGKVAVLDDADDLDDVAANCFLKTLEEPPPRSMLILIGSSRRASVADHSVALSHGAFRAVAWKCGGSHSAPTRHSRSCSGQTPDPRGGRQPRTALALTDDELWECRGKLLAGLARERIDGLRLAADFVKSAEKAGKDAPAQRARPPSSCACLWRPCPMR